MSVSRKSKASKNHQKTVTIQVWDDYLEEAVDDIRYKDKLKQIYPQRKEAIERSFAVAKTNYGIEFTRCCGNNECSMTGTCFMQ